MLPACLLLVGCTSLEGTDDKGFITSDGVVTQIDPGDREEPVSLEGEDLDGDPITLDDFRGKPAVVVVWGSWCTPCREEAPDVVAARKELGDRAGFIGINIRDTGQAQARSFVERHRIDWPSVYSPDGEALLAFHGEIGPNAIPSFVVLDDQGRIAASIIGKLPSTTTLVQVTEDVLDDSGGDGGGDG